MENKEFAWKLGPAMVKTEKDHLEWVFKSEQHLRELLAKLRKENAELRAQLDRLEKK